jgi:hypothetical protein
MSKCCEKTAEKKRKKKKRCTLPSTTTPKTACLLSKYSRPSSTNVIKNCEPASAVVAFDVMVGSSDEPAEEFVEVVANETIPF